MIIEDDIDIRQSIADALSFEGYDVLTAKNGKEALEVLKRQDQACLILLDLMMPVMSGWEFLELKKRDLQLASIPTMVVSAVAEQVQGSSGINGYLRKPVNLDALLSICRAYCGEAQQASAAVGKKAA